MLYLYFIKQTQTVMKDFRVELIEAAAKQGVELRESEIEHLFNVADCVRENRLISFRIDALRRAGYEVTQKPMHTGHGLVLCMRRMHDDSLRIRVSANWGGKQCNYAYCVHI